MEAKGICHLVGHGPLSGRGGPIYGDDVDDSHYQLIGLKLLIFDLN